MGEMIQRHHFTFCFCFERIVRGNRGIVRGDGDDWGYPLPEEV